MTTPLDGKKRGNRGFFGKKTSSKAAFLILPIHNSSENVLLLLSLYPLILSSSFRLPAAKSGIRVFGKDNTGKSKGDDPGSISVEADGGTEANDLGTKIDADTGVDNLGTEVDNSGTVIDNPGRVINNSGIIVDNPGTAVDDLGIKTDVDARIDNLRIATSNKAYAASFVAYIVHFFARPFLLISDCFFAIILAIFILNHYAVKPILSYSMTSIKQGLSFSKIPMIEMWTPSPNKVLSRISAMVRLT